jgi:hypothetical protein
MQNLSSKIIDICNFLRYFFKKNFVLKYEILYKITKEKEEKKEKNMSCIK